MNPFSLFIRGHRSPSAPAPRPADEVLAPGPAPSSLRPRRAASGTDEVLALRTTTTTRTEVVTAAGDVVHSYADQVRVRTVPVPGLTRERLAADLAEREAAARRPAPAPRTKPETRPALVRERVVTVRETFDPDSGELLSSTAQQVSERTRPGSVAVQPSPSADGAQP